MRSWRTSLTAIGAIASVIGKIAADGLGAVTPETIGIVIAAIGLLLARDERQHQIDTSK